MSDGLKTFSGSVYVLANGKLGVWGGDGSGAIPDASVVDVAGLFTLYGNSETIGGLTGSGIVQGHNAVLTVANATNGTFSGTLRNNPSESGSIALTKTGSGALTLGGTSTYTGNTTINTGTLKVTGSIATSDVTVNGGILASGATGTVGNNVTVNTGATFAAGDVAAVGTASVANDLNFSSGSIFDWDLTTGSNTYDTVSVTNTLNITTGAIFNVASSMPFTDTFWNTSHTWSDIFGGKAIDNFLVANFLYSGSATAPTAEGYFTVSGSSLTWTAVPEPTSALAGLLLTAGLLRRRRH
jgi:autotransporter-associated beta strand protein